MQDTRLPARFPERLRELRALLPQLVAILEQGRGDEWYAFAWLEETVTLSAVCGRNEGVQQDTDRGVVLRIFARGIQYESACNRLDESALIEMARALRARVEADDATGMPLPVYRPRSWAEEYADPLPPELRSQLPAGPPAVEQPVHLGVRCTVDPWITTADGLRTLAAATRQRVLAANGAFLRRENAARPEAEAYPALAEVRVLARQTVHTHVFVDRTRNLSQVLPVTLLYALGIMPGGQTGRTLAGGLGGLEIAVLPDDSLAQSAEMPARLSRAERLAPGAYRLITGPDVTGVIAHEAFGHTQEGDTCMCGRSVAPGLRARRVRVGNDQASIVNNPAVFSMDHLFHGPNGSYFFDHEGCFARSQTILDRGWLSAPMTNLTAALALGEPRTANGKRESWRRPLMVRQTNTYFTPGDATLEELIARVPSGFLAHWAHGGMEDPKGGSLTAGTEYLEEIRDGRLTGRLFVGPTGGHVELSDPVFSLLARIEGKTGSRHPRGIPENKYGGCGKYHKESVNAGCGGPWILWSSVTCG